ncbi:MAG: glycosyltransferase family 2 protein [Flavobacterium sp.]|nr:glycosyltransferase family 2 protein [Flavobacterium sp.]
MIPQLDIVIVNWNAGNYLRECIHSMNIALSNSFELKSIVIVDNASTDNSLDDVEDVDLPIRIIRNDSNVGFGKACNAGVWSCNSEYLLILNPDTRLFSNSIDPVIQFMQQEVNKEIGMVGVQIIDDEGNISRNCARFPTPTGSIYRSFGLDRLFPKVFQTHFMVEWDHKESRIVDQIMGSFIILRRDLFEMLKGYDDDFFVYYEDLDLAYRGFKLGYKNYYLADAQVYHKGGGTSDNIKATRLAYILHSKLIYSKKHFSRAWYYLVFLTTLIFEPIVRVLHSIFRGSFDQAKEVVLAYKKLYYALLFSSKS